MKSRIGIAILLMVATDAAHAQVQIYPSGDTTGATDQASIQAALDAAGSDEKAMVKLAAGTFYLNGGVGVTGYRGTLQGAGMNKTKVIALGTGNPSNRGSVFLFVDGAATIKNLSIDVPDGSQYLDSAPISSVADGGAAIDIFGGSATIQAVQIKSNGPFLPFGQESLEHGVLLHNCDGEFVLTDSTFEGVKRAVLFNPEEPSQCDLHISANHFETNRGGIMLWGGFCGSKDGNIGNASVRGNTFDDTRVNDIIGLCTDYSIKVAKNEIQHPTDGGNAAIYFRWGNGPLSITENETNGLYAYANIYLYWQYGGSVISENTVNGRSINPNGAIDIESSNNVLINKNRLTKNPFIPGWSVPGLETSGAYSLTYSTNIQIRDERLPTSSKQTCQVLHRPEIYSSNQIDSDLIECAAGF